jgi:large subunit ribosomal protein L29
VKSEELRTLEADELTQRLKDSRRELFELRFKHAVGQLENHRQILKVRKDIARILTVIHENRLGVAHPAAEAAEAGGVATAVAVAEPETETPEDVEERPEASAEVEEAPVEEKKPSRKRASKEETE